MCILMNNNTIRKNRIPVLSIVGSSGTGKTTLMEKLIPEFKSRGFKVGTIKHHIHGFEMDKPGKDSWRHKQAGADVSMISSPDQIGIVMDVVYDHKPDELLQFFNNVDIILTEGYKTGDNFKIEIIRPDKKDLPVKPLCTGDERLLAVISDFNIDTDVPKFSTEDIEGLAVFIINFFSLL